MLDKYITIGHTQKTYGSKGQVKLVIQNQFLDDFLKSDFIFMNLLGKPAPFFIESIEEMDTLLLKVEEIDSPEQAKSIVSKEVYLREKDLSKPPVDIPDTDLEYGDLIGYLLRDLDLGDIGKIKEIQEFPQQEMAVVDYDGKEIFIPLHYKLIAEFDEDGKKITLRLPEGLLDL